VISVTQKATATAKSDEPMDPYEYFFRRYGHPPVPRDVDGQGSGIIYRQDGFILTNGHVVDQADKIKVRLQDGREFVAKRVGVDGRTDLAVIKIETNGLPVATLADSDKVRVGQWAIAIGTPFELDYSFTVGHISAKGRSMGGMRGGNAYEDYLQTDAAINPGNSGGPLCDIEGRVVGINTLIRGLNRGIGFAIPSNMARGIVDQLIASGRVRRPWIGISIRALEDTKDLAEWTKDLKHGVVVQQVLPGTPAAASDLKPADIIVAVDGNAVGTPKELQLQILKKPVGQEVTLDVVRDGKKIKLGLKTAEMAEEQHIASNRPAPKTKPKPKTEKFLGATVQPLNPEMAKQLELPDATGVLVTDVTDGSAADNSGLQPGDIITEVDRTPVGTLEQFKAATAAADRAKGVLLYVRRGGEFAFVVIKEK
jgi:Do/DeqQ family serine protease